MAGEARPGRAGRRLGRLLTPKSGLLALAALFGGVIVVNAVALQTEKHPSPLFRTLARPAELFPVPPARPDSTPIARQAALTPPSGGVRTPAQDKAAPQDKAKTAAQPAEAADPLVEEIQRELSRRGLFRGEADGRLTPATVKSIREFQFSQRLAVDGKPSEELLATITASKATMKDELLDLLKKTADVEKPNRTVLDVQRALNKAGYGPLTEDGNLGPSTRAAIARFETDRKLPAKGEPKGPVLQVLATATGMPIAR